MYVRETDEYEKLYSLHVLGVEDRGEDRQLDVYKEFQESISKRSDGRYEVGVPWIPGAKLSNTNEEPSRKRLHNVERKLRRSEKLKIEYDNIVHEQIDQGIVEKVPEQPTGERIFFMGQEACTIEDIELDGDEVTKLQVRLNEKRQHVWQRWKKEYVHGLMESHRIKRGGSDYPEIGEIVLIIGDEKNRGEWKKGRVLRHIRGRDGVVRGVGLLHKGN